MRLEIKCFTALLGVSSISPTGLSGERIHSKNFSALIDCSVNRNCLLSNTSGDYQDSAAGYTPHTNLMF